MHLPKLSPFFLVIDRTYGESTILHILMTLTFGSKHYNETGDPIFLIFPLSSIRFYIYFLHFKTYKIQFHFLAFALLPDMQNTHSRPKITFYILKYRYLFFHTKVHNFWYITGFVPSPIPIQQKSHRLFLTKKSGLNSLHLTEGGDYYNLKQTTNWK